MSAYKLHALAMLALLLFAISFATISGTDYWDVWLKWVCGLSLLGATIAAFAWAVNFWGD